MAVSGLPLTTAHRRRLLEFKRRERENTPVRNMTFDTLHDSLVTLRTHVAEIKQTFRADECGGLMRIDSNRKKNDKELAFVENWRRLCVYIPVDARAKLEFKQVRLLRENLIKLNRLARAIEFVDNGEEGSIAALEAMTEPAKHAAAFRLTDKNGNLVPLMPKTIDAIELQIESLAQEALQYLSECSLDCNRDMLKTIVNSAPTYDVQPSNLMGPPHEPPEDSDYQRAASLYLLLALLAVKPKFQDTILMAIISARGKAVRASLTESINVSSDTIGLVAGVFGWLLATIRSELAFVQDLFKLAAPSGLEKVDSPQTFLALLINHEILSCVHETWNRVFQIEFGGISPASQQPMKIQDPYELLCLFRDQRRKVNELLQVEYLDMYLGELEKKVFMIFEETVEEKCIRLSDYIVQDSRVPTSIKSVTADVSRWLNFLRLYNADVEELIRVVDQLYTTVINSARIQTDNLTYKHSLLINIFHHLKTSLDPLITQFHVSCPLYGILDSLVSDTVSQLALKELKSYLNSYGLGQYVEAGVRTVRLKDGVEADTASAEGLPSQLYLFSKGLDKIYAAPLVQHVELRKAVKKEIVEALIEVYRRLYDLLPEQEQQRLQHDVSTIATLLDTEVGGPIESCPGSPSSCRS